METAKKIALVLIVGAVVLVPWGSADAQQSVSLDSVTSVWGFPTDSIFGGTEVRFFLRVTNTPGDGCAYNTALSWKVYSPDGAVWASTVPDTLGTLGGSQFEWFLFDSSGVTGSGADTVSIVLLWLMAEKSDTALYDGFDDVAFTVTIWPDAGSDGQTVCIDTVTADPSFLWEWTPLSPCSGDVTPDWDGPHCYTIKSCCGYYGGGITGNTNFDDQGKINLGDITRLIDYVYLHINYIGCKPNGEIDASGDGRINMGDITKLIDYIYHAASPPAACD